MADDLPTPLEPSPRRGLLSAARSGYLRTAAGLDDLPARPEDASLFMINQHLLAHYLDRFARLNRAAHPSLGRAPHKPILLLTLLDAVEQGIVKGNFVPITPELAAIFRQHWQALVSPGTWQEKMNLPFRHLLHDGFWDLIKDGQPQTAKMVGEPSSLMQLAQRVDGGRFSPELWPLVQEPVARQALRSQLLSTYFADAEQLNLAQPIDLLAREAERLMTEAKAKFRIRTPRENDDAGLFVRHALFPAVVKGLYMDACAVCCADTRTDGGRTLIDAAHILPFATHHNDDPRNGLALCKNHHWGFDAGAFGVSDDYKIIVSKRVTETVSLVVAATQISVPEKSEFAPAVEALRWHRQNVFLR